MVAYALTLHWNYFRSNDDNKFWFLQWIKTFSKEFPISNMVEELDSNLQLHMHGNIELPEGLEDDKERAKFVGKFLRLKGCYVFTKKIYSDYWEKFYLKKDQKDDNVIPYTSPPPNPPNSPTVSLPIIKEDDFMPTLIWRIDEIPKIVALLKPMPVSFSLDIT